MCQAIFQKKQNFFYKNFYIKHNMLWFFIYLTQNMLYNGNET